MNAKRPIILLCVALALILMTTAAVGCSPEQPTGGEAKAETSSNGQTGGGESRPDSSSFTWSSTSDCSVCHTSEASSLADPKQPQAVVHADNQCMTCHSAENVLTEAHEGVDYDSKPASKASVRTVDQQICIDCHGDMDKVAPLTAESTALKDSNGLVVNPHQRPVGESHSKNPLGCTDCHKVHSENLARDAMKQCASCHHRGVFQCGTCHAVEGK